MSPGGAARDADIIAMGLEDPLMIIIQVQASNPSDSLTVLAMGRHPPTDWRPLLLLLPTVTGSPGGAAASPRSRTRKPIPKASIERAITLDNQALPPPKITRRLIEINTIERHGRKNQ